MPHAAIQDAVLCRGCPSLCAIAGPSPPTDERKPPADGDLRLVNGPNTTTGTVQVQSVLCSPPWRSLPLSSWACARVQLKCLSVKTAGGRASSIVACFTTSAASYSAPGDANFVCALSWSGLLPRHVGHRMVSDRQRFHLLRIMLGPLCRPSARLLCFHHAAQWL